MKSMIKFFLLLVIASTIVLAKQDANLHYPLTPPSGDYCDSLQRLGGDVYGSLFSPCVFTFFKHNSSIAPTISNSFSCGGIANSTNYESIDSEVSPVIGWPDSCVANGPRCYNLTEFPNLSNFTEFTESKADDNYSNMVFPSDADYVSVDCSHDFELAQKRWKNIPEELEPLTQSIIFFGFTVFVGCIIVSAICCCLCGGGRRSGYSKIGGVYAGPPVEARKIIV